MEKQKRPTRNDEQIQERRQRYKRSMRLKEQIEQGNFDNIKTWNFSNWQIFDPFKIFVENCHRFSQLQEIQCRSILIRDQEFEIFLEKSQHMVNIKKIDFRMNHINHIMKYFCDVSANLPNLETMRFEHNQIDDSGLIAFVLNSEKYPRLSKVILNENLITDDGVIIFAEHAYQLPSLKNFDFSQNKITDEGFKSILENSTNFPKLKSIHLQGNFIQASNLREISTKFKSLSSINLRDNNINDDGLKKLVPTDLFQQLSQINLGKNKITDVGVKALVNNGLYPKLTILCMESNNLTHMGLLLLIKNTSMMPNLREIDLRVCGMIYESKLPRIMRQQLNMSSVRV